MAVCRLYVGCMTSTADFPAYDLCIGWLTLLPLLPFAQPANTFIDSQGIVKLGDFGGWWV